MEIDINELRSALLTYYGTAIHNNPMAIMELGEIEHATAEELVEMADQLGWL